MVTLARRAHRIPFAPVVAVLFGVVAAILVAAVPQWMFEAGVVASGLPTLLAAAAPPLGLVARLLAIGLAFAATSFILWSVMAPLTMLFEARARARTPWRDAGYDVDHDQRPTRSESLPPRRPIFAPDELGAPLMSDEVVALTDAFPAPPPALDIARALPDEAFEGTGSASVQPDNSIMALIRRLEDGLARRAANDEDPDGPGSADLPLLPTWMVADIAGAAADAEDDDGDTSRAVPPTATNKVRRS